MLYEVITPAPGDWLSIYFNNDNNGGYPTRGTFNHAHFRYGGSTTAMLQIRFDQAFRFLETHRLEDVQQAPSPDIV